LNPNSESLREQAIPTKNPPCEKIPLLNPLSSIPASYSLLLFAQLLRSWPCSVSRCRRRRPITSHSLPLQAPTARDRQPRSITSTGHQLTTLTEWPERP